MPIFDQGYQHWSGELSGHTWRWLAITRHGVRVALSNRWIRGVLAARHVAGRCARLRFVRLGLARAAIRGLIASIQPLINSFLDQPILAGSTRLSRRNLDALLQLFSATSSCGSP